MANKLLQFSATWCVPCKQMEKIVEKVVETTSVEFEKIDVEANQDQAGKYNVRGVPTFIVVDENGEALGVKTGAMSVTKLMEFVKNPSN